MRHLFLAAIATLLCPAAAQAQGCFGAGLPLFHCSVKNGTKTLDICMQGDVGYYYFGPKDGVAEMILAHKVQDIHLLPWNGVGSSVYEEIEFWGGDVTFQVHYALDRIAAENPNITGGVRVFRADQMLADLTCDPGSVSDREFYPLYEAKEAAGQCWSHESFSWSEC